MTKNIDMDVDTLLDVTWTLNNLKDKIKDVPTYGEYMVARIEMAYCAAKDIKRAGHGTSYSDSYAE